MTSLTDFSFLTNELLLVLVELLKTMVKLKCTNMISDDDIKTRADKKMKKDSTHSQDVSIFCRHVSDKRYLQVNMLGVPSDPRGNIDFHKFTPSVNTSNWCIRLGDSNTGLARRMTIYYTFRRYLSHYNT